jgi:hypothetical protein
MEYQEGGHSKVGNGWVKKGGMTDFEWAEFLADNGHSFYMHQLAGMIIVSDTYADRQIYAYKWAFLAAFLNRKSWGGALDLLQSVLSQEIVDRGLKLAESWVEEKAGDQLEIDKTGWSSELRALFTDDSNNVSKNFSSSEIRKFLNIPDVEGEELNLKLLNIVDPTLLSHVLNSMTVGMKGELFAAIVLTQLGCLVENVNARKVNSRHVDLLVARGKRELAVQVKSTASGSKGSFVAVNDSLISDNQVKWYCIVTINNAQSKLISLVFIHVNELLRVGNRFPSNPKRCEVQHNVIATLEKYSAPEWVSKVFEFSP